MTKIISFGGGVNSVAMTIMLYKRGEIYPLVFADTMAEHPETYCYMDYFEREFLSKYGQKIVRLNPYKTPEYFRPQCQFKSLEEYCIERQIIPTFKNRHCTQNYKQEPNEKYRNGIDAIFGFAYDERHRGIKDEYYPLIENKITRQGCIDIIRDEGLSVPIKSGCFFCCFQRLDNWEKLHRNYPDYYGRAEYIENIAYSKNNKMTYRGDGKRLSFLRERFEAKGGELFPDYDYEELTPCMCIT